MRKELLSVVWSLSAVCLAQGALIQDELAPTPADLGGSGHYRGYAWGLSRNSNDEALKTVGLPLESLDDSVNAVGVLCIHLRDSASAGVKTCPDKTTFAWLAGESMLLAADSHPGTGPNLTANWTYLFAPQGLNTLRSHVGVGFDSRLGPENPSRDTGADSILMKHALEPAPLLIGGLAVTPLLYGKRR